MKTRDFKIFLEAEKTGDQKTANKFMRLGPLHNGRRALFLPNLADSQSRQLIAVTMDHLEALLSEPARTLSLVPR